MYSIFLFLALCKFRCLCKSKCSKSWTQLKPLLLTSTVKFLLLLQWLHYLIRKAKLDLRVKITGEVNKVGLGFTDTTCRHMI